MTYQSRSDIRRLLERHGLHPRKSLGQHFLADPNLIRKVVEVAGVGPSDRVVEVGAGTGALTVALAAAGAHVVAYEVDERLRPVLEETVADTGIDLRFVDVMDVDLQAELEGDRWKLVANLPYNVGTPLVLDVLMRVTKITSATVMVQREVADRLAARPGTPDYGVPSVVVSLCGRVVERFSVPPQVFVPVPQVDSAVVRIDRIEPPPHWREAVDMARRAFGQRRKMLRRSLADTVSEEAYARADIDPQSRPEELSPSDFVALAEALADG